MFEERPEIAGSGFGAVAFLSKKRRFVAYSCRGAV
jgi:hypothetical protein